MEQVFIAVFEFIETLVCSEYKKTTQAGCHGDEWPCTPISQLHATNRTTGDRVMSCDPVRCYVVITII